MSHPTQSRHTKPLPTSQELGLPSDPSSDHQGYVAQALAHLFMLNDELAPADFCKRTWNSTFVNLGECAHWCFRIPHHMGPCVCPCHSQTYTTTLTTR